MSQTPNHEAPAFIMEQSPESVHEEQRKQLARGPGIVCNFMFVLGVITSSFVFYKLFQLNFNASSFVTSVEYGSLMLALCGCALGCLLLLFRVGFGMILGWISLVAMIASIVTGIIGLTQGSMIPTLVFGGPIGIGIRVFALMFWVIPFAKFWDWQRECRVLKS